jgi:hypothetical protein
LAAGGPARYYNLTPVLREHFATLLGQRYLPSGVDTRLQPRLRAVRRRVDPRWVANAN